jgi:hypothetical protein
VTAPFAYRGPDGEILLEDALGPHLQHYVAVMVSGAAGTRMQVIALGGGDTPHGLLIRQAYGRPTRASPCGEVAVQPSFVWDACAYYLRLGVHWTATKKELRIAYLAADPQQADARLHYCLTQLMDDVIRAAYDRVPLGGVFLWDRDIAAQIKRAAAAEAARRMADGGEATAGDVMDEMGFQEVPREQAYEEAREEAGPAAVEEAPRLLWGSRWGHYVLSGPQGAPRADTALLEAWQGMVAAALRERGMTAPFAVAQGSEGDPLVLRDINEPCIFVMTQKGTSPDMAREAVEMGITLGIVTDDATGDI